MGTCVHGLEYLPESRLHGHRIYASLIFWIYPDCSQSVLLIMLLALRKHISGSTSCKDTHREQAHLDQRKTTFCFQMRLPSSRSFSLAAPFISDPQRWALQVFWAYCAFLVFYSFLYHWNSVLTAERECLPVNLQDSAEWKPIISSMRPHLEITI